MITGDQELKATQQRIVRFQRWLAQMRRTARAGEFVLRPLSSVSVFQPVSFSACQTLDFGHWTLDNGLWITFHVSGISAFQLFSI